MATILPASAGLLAAYPRIALGVAPHLTGVAVSAIAAYITKRRLVFAAGILGTVLFPFMNQVRVSWKTSATWWDQWSFHFFRDALSGAIGAMICCFCVSAVYFFFTDN